MSMNIIEDIAYLIDWFNEHEACFIKPYIEQHFDRVSWESQLEYMRAHPFFAKKIIEDYMMANREKQLKFLNSLAFGKSKIVVIEGGRGSGKTADAAWTMEELHKRKMHKKIYFVKKGSRPSDMPPWINHVQDIGEVPNNSFAVLDESAIRYSSRATWEDDNKDFVKRLAILRHKGITVIVITQHIKMIDIGIRRLSDISVSKMGASLSHDDEKTNDERHLVRKRLEPHSVEDSLIEVKLTGEFYRFSHGVPEWFTDKFSKSFGDFNPEAETRKNKAEMFQFKREQKERELDKLKEIELAKIDKMKEIGIAPPPLSIKKEFKKISIENVEDLLITR